MKLTENERALLSATLTDALDFLDIEGNDEEADLMCSIIYKLELFDPPLERYRDWKARQ